MTHGITDFNISFPGELDFNYSGIYSTSCKAEQLWNVTAEAGKKNAGLALAGRFLAAKQ